MSRTGGKRCRHEWIRRSCETRMASGVSRLYSDPNPIVDARVCCDCGAWLPLGPSNDSPEAVQIEIRAAEMIACGLDGRDDVCNCDWNDDSAREIHDIARDIVVEHDQERQG